MNNGFDMQSVLWNEFWSHIIKKRVVKQKLQSLKGYMDIKYIFTQTRK